MAESSAGGTPPRRSKSSAAVDRPPPSAPLATLAADVGNMLDVAFPRNRDTRAAALLRPSLRRVFEIFEGNLPQTSVILIKIFEYRIGYRTRAERGLRLKVAPCRIPMALRW